MMNNLFTMFDPTTSSYMALNWCILLFMFIFKPKTFFNSKNRTEILLTNLKKTIWKSLKSNLKKSQQKNVFMLMTYFMFIYIMNITSMLPFLFCTSSHLSFSLYLSLPFWLSLMLKGWIETPLKMSSHMVPYNTPFLLSFFMVLIETISNLMRPFTLSIRLTANMMAGHILMALSSSMLNNNLIIFSFSSMALNTLITLEMFVCLIQSYVFITLLSLYMNEIE